MQCLHTVTWDAQACQLRGNSACTAAQGLHQACYLDPAADDWQSRAYLPPAVKRQSAVHKHQIWFMDIRLLCKLRHLATGAQAPPAWQGLSKYNKSDAVQARQRIAGCKDVLPGPEASVAEDFLHPRSNESLFPPSATPAAPLASAGRVASPILCLIDHSLAGEGGTLAL